MTIISSRDIIETQRFKNTEKGVRTLGNYTAGKDWKIAKEHRMLETAYQLFCKKGIEAATMPEIAQVSGVGRATLYRYFPTKLDLVVTIGTWKWQEYIEAYRTPVSAEQIAAIVRAMFDNGQKNILITRIDSDKSENLKSMLRVSNVPVEKDMKGSDSDNAMTSVSETDYIYFEDARLVIIGGNLPVDSEGYIAVITAGTSDIPVAEEAARTAEFLGNRVVRIYDAGVAGLHRLLAHIDEIMDARVIIAIAGMEGALASVVGGLASCPVIAVPTSVGYGASFEGLSALLSMLNSCASGVSVVNIDNGFGAAYQASMINHM